MPLQWSTSGQQVVSHGIKLCVYGRSGAGKTKLIETAPRPIIASAEKGTLSIAAANVPLAIINNVQDLQEFHAWLLNDPQAKNFDTVCLDSISEIAEKCLSEEKGASRDPRAAYGEMQDRVAVLVRQFRDLPEKNVYFSAKAEIREQPDGKMLYGAGMPGKKSSQGLAYFFDEFFYLGIGSTDVPDPATGVVNKIQYRYLQTQADTQYEAKDRSGVLEAVEEPHLDKIFQKIRAAFKVA